MTEYCISELQWWQKSFDSVNNIYYPLPQLTMYSGASPNGWGAACGKHSTGGSWTKEESSLHINVLEMAAAFFAVKIYARALSETSVHLRVDITANLAWTNREDAPNETVYLILKEICKFYVEKQIWVHASYISSRRNKVADKESRKLRGNLEWSLK